MLRTLVQNFVPGDTGGRIVRNDLNPKYYIIVTDFSSFQCQVTPCCIPN